MECHECKSADLIVVDSRHTNSAVVYRRHKCRDCDHRFTTYEFVDLLSEIRPVIKEGIEKIEDALASLKKKANEVI